MYLLIYVLVFVFFVNLFSYFLLTYLVNLNVVALQRAEMSMVRWMCGVKLKDRLPSKELRERLGVDDIALILQQNSEQ